METVHVFAVIDGFDDALLIDVVRQGELYYKTIYIGVFIELPDAIEELRLGDRFLEANERRVETTGAIISRTSAAISALMVAATAFPSIRVITIRVC